MDGSSSTATGLILVQRQHRAQSALPSEPSPPSLKDRETFRKDVSEPPGRVVARLCTINLSVPRGYLRFHGDLGAGCTGSLAPAEDSQGEEVVEQPPQGVGSIASRENRATRQAPLSRSQRPTTNSWARSRPACRGSPGRLWYPSGKPILIKIGWPHLQALS